MKKMFFLLIALSLNFVNAQIIKNGNYVFVRDEASYELSTKKNKSERIVEGYKIKVDSVSSEKVYYRYAPFKRINKNDKDSIIDNASIYNGKMFSMSLIEFKLMTEPSFPKFKGFSVGGISIPIRLRGKNDTFTFDNDLSLGVNLLLGWGKSTTASSWIDGSVGLSITKINLTKDNSNLIDSRSASALTFSIGGILKLNQLVKNPYIDKNPINLGFFMGFDSLGANDLKVDWVYNKQLWIGIGINVGLTPTSTNQGNQAN